MKPLEELGKFATVVIDPPWKLSEPGFIRQEKIVHQGLAYGSMSFDDILSLPVQSVADSDCILFCWTVNKYLPFTFELISQWGFSYWFTMSWVKGGGIQFPNTPSFNTEWLIVGRKGSPRFTDTKGFRAGNFWERQGHSAKPEGFYDLLRRVTPGPRLDIFGRRRIAGFESWGNEAPDGPALPDYYQQVLIG